MEFKCLYCFKEILEPIVVCNSCESLLSLVKDEGLSPLSLIRELHLVLSRDRSCERCGYIFNREILEFLKLTKNIQITDEQRDNCSKLLFCPECRSFSKKMYEYYNQMIYKKTIGYQRMKAYLDEKWEKEWKPISKKERESILPSYYRGYNPLKKQEILPKLDKELTKRIRVRRKQWIDYFGIVLRKKYQIYSNIESEYLEDQNKLDSIAESFFSGDLNEKIYKIYSDYLKEYKGFRIPNFYFLEKDDITYIIIGIFRFARRAKLILKKMALVIENLNHKKVVDVTNKVVDIDMLDKSGKEIIQYLMRTFIIDIEHYLFPKGKEKEAILLSALNYRTGHLDGHI